MKYHRVVVSQHGGPDVLQMVEADLPEPRAGEVRVKVLAAPDRLAHLGAGQAGPHGPEEEFVIVERGRSITWELNSGIFALQ